MTNINCSSDCIYQKDGKCSLECISSQKGFHDRDCAYYQAKIIDSNFKN